MKTEHNYFFKNADIFYFSRRLWRSRVAYLRMLTSRGMGSKVNVNKLQLARWLV